jgi:hypothetical protein
LTSGEFEAGEGADLVREVGLGERSPAAASSADLVREVDGAAIAAAAELLAAPRLLSGEVGVLAAAAPRITVRGVQRRDFEPLTVIFARFQAASERRSRRRPVSLADIARVSPLAHAHVIPSGTYHFERVAVTSKDEATPLP